MYNFGLSECNRVKRSSQCDLTLCYLCQSLIQIFRFIQYSTTKALYLPILISVSKYCLCFCNNSTLHVCFINFWYSCACIVLTSEKAKFLNYESNDITGYLLLRPLGYFQGEQLYQSF